MIDILYSGYNYTHDNGIRFDSSLGDAAYDCYLLLFAHSPVNILSDGEIKSYPANTLVLFAPDCRKYYFSTRGEPYTNDWIHFRTDEKFIERFTLKNIPFSPSDPDYIHNIIRLICWEGASDSSDNNPLIKDLFHLLMGKLNRDMSEEASSPYYRELLKLRREIVLHPERSWNVPDMAEKLNISTAHLQFLYRSTFNISCIDDVIQNRIRLAQEKLMYASDPISEVAEQCGYKNTEHFCRQFKKVTGITPRKYRVSSRKEE